MREENTTQTPTDIAKIDSPRFDPEEVFADPVTYLERFGMSAELVGADPILLAPAA